MKTKLFYLFTLLFVSVSYLSATTYYVRSDGDDENPGTEAEPFKNLTKVFGTSITLADGDIIDIGEGTFSYNKQGTISVSITMKGAGKNLTFIQGTLADAGKRCLTIGSTSPVATPTVLIEDVTFKNFGRYGDPVTFANDGLIYFNGGNLTCRRVNFVNNQAQAGGAISIFRGGTVTLEDCYFSGNSATQNSSTNAHGGAINVSTSATLSLTIDRCLFENNTTEARGGALRLSLTGSVGSTVLVQNSTFTGNIIKSNGSAESGTIDVFPASASDAEFKFINNTIAYNVSEVATTGKAGINIGTNAIGKVTLINNIIYSQNSPSAISINISDGGLKESRNNITDTNFNFDTKTASSMSSGNQSSVTGEALKLAAALAENGGETETLAIGAGSVAVNTGYTTGVPEIDQTGYSRTSPDVGAYEWRDITSVEPNISKEVINYSQSNGKVVFNGTGDYNSVKIYTTTGQFIQSNLLSGNTFEYSSNAGMYFFLFEGDGRKGSVKIVLTK